MKVNINPSLSGMPSAICRTPLFTTDERFEEAWPELKRIIRETSPNFYPFIQDLQAEDLAQQQEKIRYTVWKYYNRSRYRSTPFDEFASLSLIPIDQRATTLIRLSRQSVIHQWPSWQTDPAIRYTKAILKAATFRTNPTCYFSESAYRYLYRGETGFSLNVAPDREDVSLILEHCMESRSYFDIADRTYEQLLIEEKALLALLEQLLELQVLECDLFTNITGRDYFERTGKGEDPAMPLYRMATRHLISGGISSDVTGQLSDYVRFIQPCLPLQDHPQLAQFKNDFIHKWEQKAIPLSLALDPLSGIGYGRSADAQQPSLVGKLQERQADHDRTSIHYGHLERFLLSQMISRDSIHLESFRGSDGESAAHLPNTISTIFHLHRDGLVLHSAGGASGTALIGRFTHIAEYYQHGLSIAAIEKEANPGAIFFDLAYQCEGETDNVNRRQNLYETELALGSWSTLERPLRLSEILVSVHEGKVMLHYEKTGQRLIPRLASAYNYERSDLDLFRFLCDLQHQELNSNLTFDLSAIFPGLDHYPRVYYREIIVNPAKWLMPEFRETGALKEWLGAKQIGFPFLAGLYDQTLTFDPAVESDLEFLLLYSKQRGQPFYISEALIPGEAVQNESGKAYHAQFILQLSHLNPVYDHLSYQKGGSIHRDLRMPGSDWLYLELYLRPEVTDQYLDNEVRQLIRSQQHLISIWFFIRYSSPEPHIRLRLKLKNAESLAVVLERVREIMNIRDHYGHLQKLEIKGYEREILRYGHRLMGQVENFFYLDSTWAMRQIRLPEERRYHEIISFVQCLCGMVYGDLREQTAFYREMAGQYATEFSLTNADFKLINRAFHHVQPSKQGNKRLQNAFRKLMEDCSPERRGTLLGDLIHLHVNRRFSGAQRLHEAVLYQFLYKQSQSRKYL